MADDDTRLDSGAGGTTEAPPPGPEASSTGLGHPAQDAAPVPDSIAQPGQALPQNTTIAPATTTTKLPLGTGPGLEARMPLAEDDATIAHDSAAVAEGNDAAERHHQAPQAGQGNTAATAPHDAAQETSSIGQAAQNPDIVPLLPAETAAIQSSGVSEMPVGGETQAQANFTPMPDPASALHHPPPEPATDAAPPPAAASPGELPVPHFVAPSSYLRPKTSQRRGHPPTAAMASHEHRPPPGPYDKEQLQGLVSFLLSFRGLSCARVLACMTPPCDACCRWPSRSIESACLFSQNADVSGYAESHTRFPQSPNELRCLAALVPPYRPRHKPAHQEELEYPHTKLYGSCSPCHAMLLTVDEQLSFRHRYGTPKDPSSRVS